MGPSSSGEQKFSCFWGRPCIKNKKSELSLEYTYDYFVSFFVQYERKFDIPERILFMALESVLYDEEQVRVCVI